MFTISAVIIGRSNREWLPIAISQFKYRTVELEPALEPERGPDILPNEIGFVQVALG